MSNVLTMTGLPRISRAPRPSSARETPTATLPGLLLLLNRLALRLALHRLPRPKLRYSSRPHPPHQHHRPSNEASHRSCVFAGISFLPRSHRPEIAPPAPLRCPTSAGPRSERQLPNVVRSPVTKPRPVPGRAGFRARTHGRVAAGDKVFLASAMGGKRTPGGHTRSDAVAPKADLPTSELIG